MLQSTLCFVFNQQWHILLCKKKRWFGIGKWNGAWGKQTDWETIEQTAIREFHEEIWLEIQPDKLQKKWLLHFTYEAKPEWDQTVHVFLATDFTWEPKESEEVAPAWWAIEAIPYDIMWEDDAIWLPTLLAWEEFEYEFIFDKNNTIYSTKRIQ